MNEVKKGVGAVFMVQEGIAVVGHMEVFEAYVRVEGVPIEATIKESPAKLKEKIEKVMKSSTKRFLYHMPLSCPLLWAKAKSYFEGIHNV